MTCPCGTGPGTQLLLPTSRPRGGRGVVRPLSIQRARAVGGPGGSVVEVASDRLIDGMEQEHGQ